MPGFSIISFNAAVQDLRLLGRSLYRPVACPGERLARMPRALLDLDADIVCLQEVFHRRWREWLCRSLSRVYPHVAGTESGWPGLRLGNELLVLSRFPLSGIRLCRFTAAPPEELRFTSRGFQEMVVHVPAIGDITLVNVHASAGGLREHPESPVMEEIRARQIDEMLKSGQPGRPLLLVGDLNAGPHSSVRNYRQVLGRGLADACAAAGIHGVTWDPANPLVADGREAHLPPQRIDHVFQNDRLVARARCTSAEIVLTGRMVDSDRGKVPLSDHYGIRAEFRTADADPRPRAAPGSG
jgi:endonuclease/exonuclease/phosphatase family metal-dependent hydrolase